MVIVYEELPWIFLVTRETEDMRVMVLLYVSASLIWILRFVFPWNALYPGVKFNSLNSEHH